MNKNIYKIWTKQTFNIIIEEDGGLFKPKKIIKEKETVNNIYRLVFAKDLDEAINTYKKRYNWNKTERCLDLSYECFNHYSRIDEKNPEYVCEVTGVRKITYTFNELKEELHADDFFEYCRQELCTIKDILN